MEKARMVTGSRAGSLELRPVPGTVVIAHDGGAAHGIAQKDGDEDEVDIHDDAVHRHAAGAHEPHQLPVVEHIHH